MSSLDEIFEPFHIRGCRELPQDKVEECMAAKDKSKAQIKAWALEIIGKTEVEPATPYGAVLAVQHRNALRDKQRKRLEES